MGRVSPVPLPESQALNDRLTRGAAVPARARATPSAMMRALRVRLRMSQDDLARRCGMTQAQVARLESGRTDARLGTWRRVFDAMFCDLVVLPKPRKRPGDALAERRLEKPWGRPWAELPKKDRIAP